MTHLQVIHFDDFHIWEGRCPPSDEPFATEVAPIEPTWPEMRSDLNKPTILYTELLFKKAFVGGGCADILVTNNGEQQCDAFEVEINVRPVWGELLSRNGQPSLTGMDLVMMDPDAGAPYSTCCADYARCAAEASCSCSFWLA